MEELSQGLRNEVLTGKAEEATFHYGVDTNGVFF
jgi:hypothetical protein